MLQLRIVTPARHTDALVRALEPEAGVISLAVERGAAVKPPGQARPDGLIVDQVFLAVRDLVEDSTEPRPKHWRSRPTRSSGS